MLTEQGVAVAGRTYRNWKKAAPSARTITDAGLTDALLATVDTPEGLYGRRKMTAHLRRQGHRVAACTVDRLMGDEGLSGVVRGRKHRITVPGGKDSRRAPDLLDRDFTAAAPNRKWVADLKCRRRHLMSYADLRNMPMSSSKMFSGRFFELCGRHSQSEVSHARMSGSGW